MDDPGAHPASESGRRTSICGYWTYCATTPGARRASLALPGKGLRGAAQILEEPPFLPDRTPRGVASNSPRALVEAALETAGLGGVFDSVIGADDVREPKPAPEAYLLSCGVLGARPGRGVALEGSPTGAAAARGAGSYVIEVPSTPGVAPDAHGVVGSLTEAAVRRAVSLATTWGR